MTRQRHTWSRLVHAEMPHAHELRTVEDELAGLRSEPLAAALVDRLTHDVAAQMQTYRTPRRSRFRAMLLLLSLLLALTATASIGPRVHWPQQPSRLATAPMAEAFAYLADRNATRSNLQLAMGVLDRHVFQALTTLQQLAAVHDAIGKAAQKALEQLHVALQPNPAPASCDVGAFIAIARNGNAMLSRRLVAVHSLTTCIAAGVTALQQVELPEDDLRIARSVYVRRLLRDIEKAATPIETTPPAASDPAPTEPETAPSAK